MPKPMTDEHGNRLVTVPSKPNELIATANGTMTYAEWCQREADRNNRTSGTNKYRVHTVNGGKVCVAAR